MRRRSAAELDVLMRRLGTDLDLDFLGSSGLWEDGDLAVSRQRLLRDLAVVSGLDAADQMLVNRLKTQKGELAPLGHPEYGSRHHELIGQPNVERTRNLIKLRILEALSQEPRIDKVLSCAVTAAKQRDLVLVQVAVLLLGEDVPRNLVVPFSLEGSS